MRKIACCAFAGFFVLTMVVLAAGDSYALYIRRLIAASPGTVVGIPVDTSRHRASHYRIEYRYRVDGADYTVESGLISRGGRDIPAPSSLPPAAIAYSSAHPWAAVPADEYRRHDPAHGFLHVLAWSAIAATALAGVATLGICWDAWKLRRQHAERATSRRPRAMRKKRKA